MIKENEIRNILIYINDGNKRQKGVHPISLSKNKKYYNLVYFDGLGVYKCKRNGDHFLVKTEEEVRQEYINR